MLITIPIAYLLQSGGGGSDTKALSSFQKEQATQKQEITSLKQEYENKIEMQNKVITEYDKKLSELETVQTSLSKNMDAMQGGTGTTANTGDAAATAETPQAEQPAETPQAEQPAAEMPATLTINSADGVNLRNNFSSEAGSVELIPNDTVVTVLEGPQVNEGFNWYKVQSSTGMTGWVAKEFTK